MNAGVTISMIKTSCRLCKYVYDPETVWKAMSVNRSEPRKGSHANSEEFARLSKLLKPLIIDKKQSLPQIFQTHKTELRWSYPTILSFIDDGLIPGIKNIDLTKRVRYPKHYKKSKNEPTNRAVLENRTYDDFIAYLTENPLIEVVEMDTVLSGKGDDSCVLTLLFRKSNFMLGFLLSNKTSENVTKVFAKIQKTLGQDLYEKTFKCILTDNGSEFCNPLDIEFMNAIQVSNLFYCDPGKSGQKGKIEKNHVELRKVFPKGCSFSIYSQDDMDLALSHVNSLPREILNKNCPGIIAKAFLDDKVIGLNNYKFINPDDVELHPGIVKKKK